jgi:hypothetical protein
VSGKGLKSFPNHTEAVDFRGLLTPRRFVKSRFFGYNMSYFRQDASGHPQSIGKSLSFMLRWRAAKRYFERRSLIFSSEKQGQPEHPKAA